jgi:hypothetical protein
MRPISDEPWRYPLFHLVSALAASETRPDSHVFFTCSDLHETYRELSERGVRFCTPPKEALTVGPEADEHELAVGDALHFAADVPHVYRSAVGCSALCVFTYPAVRSR